jgi:histidyl-tRNA synthetase
VKAQFKSADRLEARYVATLGDDELANNKINVKFMETGEQVQMDLATFVEQFKKLQA